MKIGLACQEGNDLGFYLEPSIEGISLRVRRKTGAYDYYILSITPDGCIKMHSGISPDIGLKMDGENWHSKVKITNE